MRVAIVGAECTGKKTLQHALIAHLRTAPGNFVVPVVGNTATFLSTVPTYELTLLAANDLKLPDERMPYIDLATRDACDKQLRSALIANNIPHAVIYGEGQARIQCALDALAHFQKKPLPRSPHDTVWKWVCETCSDAECEHRLFSKLLTPP